MLGGAGFLPSTTSHLNVERFCSYHHSYVMGTRYLKDGRVFHIFRAICPEQKVGFKKKHHFHNSFFVFFPPQLHVKTLQGMQIEDKKAVNLDHWEVLGLQLGPVFSLFFQLLALQSIYFMAIALE